VKGADVQGLAGGLILLGIGDTGVAEGGIAK
jgi:hypothetical protein